LRTDIYLVRAKYAARHKGFEKFRPFIREASALADFAKATV
jgi:hypothetical protein